MPDKTTFQRAFNSLFIEFLDDIISIFPENDDMKTSRDSFDMIKKINPSIIIKSWYKYVFLHYATYIEHGNIDYFLNKDYSQDLSIIQKSDEMLKIIDKVREPLKTLDIYNKKICTEYLQKLNKLSLLYHESIDRKDK